MSNQNNVNQNGENGNNTGNLPAKKGLTGLADKAQRKLDDLSNSKAWRWGKRILTGAVIGITGKVCYDKGFSKGKASVVPTVVTIQQDVPETSEEEPAEEVNAEET